MRRRTLSSKRRLSQILPTGRSLYEVVSDVRLMVSELSMVESAPMGSSKTSLAYFIPEIPLETASPHLKDIPPIFNIFSGSMQVQ